MLASELVPEEMTASLKLLEPATDEEEAGKLASLDNDESAEADEMLEDDVSEELLPAEDSTEELDEAVGETRLDELSELELVELDETASELALEEIASTDEMLELDELLDKEIDDELACPAEVSDEGWDADWEFPACGDEPDDCDDAEELPPPATSDVALG